MLRPASLLLLASVSFFSLVRADEDLLKVPSEDQEIINTLSDLFGCKVKVTHCSIPTNARLTVNKDGKETLNESLEGFDDFMVIALSGKGMGSASPSGDGPREEGVRVRMIVRKTGARPKGERVVTQKEFFAFTPSGLNGGWDTNVTLSTPGYFMLNCARGRDGGEKGNLTIKMMEVMPDATK